MEYAKSNETISSYGQDAIQNKLISGSDKPQAIFDMIHILGGISASVALYLGGGTGITCRTSDGSYSLIALDGNYPLIGRCVTTGHELFGHGRPLSLGRGDRTISNIDAIQTENLIIRVMGFDLFTDGSNHGGPFITHSSLPGFR